MFFSILFLMSLGMMLYSVGIVINAPGLAFTLSGTQGSVVNITIPGTRPGENLMFAGSLLASLCWVNENLFHDSKC